MIVLRNDRPKITRWLNEFGFVLALLFFQPLMSGLAYSTSQSSFLEYVRRPLPTTYADVLKDDLERYS